MSGALPWPHDYYSALRFYFWEPQWLNRHAKARRDRSCDEVIGNIRRAEVSLNHLLGLFFSLAPSALVTRFLAPRVPGWDPQRLEIHAAPTLDVARTIDICQPDLLFTGETSIVAVEMKIGARTSLEQAIKYALFLHHFGAVAGAVRRQPFLLYLSPTSSNLWERGLTFGSVPAALADVEFTSTVRRFADACGHTRADVLAMTAALPMSHATYGDLAEFLENEIARLDGSEGAETLGQLVRGLLAELAVRGLAGGQDAVKAQGAALSRQGQV